MIYDEAHECLSREDLEQLQIERLQATLRRARQNVAFYRHSFDARGVDVEAVKSMEALRSLPFTTKEDLRRNYPYDMFAVPLKDIVRIHSTSGTTGKPIVVGYTRNDIAHWTNLIARVLAAVGITEHDFVQIAFNYSQASAGLGFHYGAEKIGASVIPSSGESTRRQAMIMRDYHTSAFISTPGFALRLAATLREEGIRPDALRARVALLGAEPWSEELRAKIEEGLGVEAYDNYGLTEIIGPGVAFECERRDGLHVNEDHFIVEVVDPATLEVLPPGAKGELVFTTLTKEGFPLIRYRTGDIASLLPGPCACGRTLVRMGRPSGRTDDMIIIDGVNVFPSQIEEAILQVPGIEPHYLIVLDRRDGAESAEVQVEASADYNFLDELSKLEALRTKLEAKLYDSIGIAMRVRMVEPDSLPRSDGGKLKRVLDRREA